MFQRLKNSWRRPIYRDDVTTVILRGLSVILFGFLIGLFDSFLSFVDFPLGFGPAIIGIFIGYVVKRSYYNYHPLYPALAIIFALLGFLVYSDASYFMYFNHSILETLSLFTNRGFYYGIISAPIILFSTTNADIIVSALIDILLFALMILFSYRISKGRN